MGSMGSGIIGIILISGSLGTSATITGSGFFGSVSVGGVDGLVTEDGDAISSYVSNSRPGYNPLTSNSELYVLVVSSQDPIVDVVNIVSVVFGFKKSLRYFKTSSTVVIRLVTFASAYWVLYTGPSSSSLSLSSSTSVVSLSYTFISSESVVKSLNCNGTIGSERFEIYGFPAAFNAFKYPLSVYNTPPIFKIIPFKNGYGLPTIFSNPSLGTVPTFPSSPTRELPL